MGKGGGKMLDSAREESRRRSRPRQSAVGQETRVVVGQRVAGGMSYAEQQKCLWFVPSRCAACAHTVSA